ncbi:lecithin retinol acyltransferase-like [Hippocampus zosterae]|uniref:lecithin retinol acyltransferase-like n=1 Tax=Hippocampus zosterae TaxID=109293 RepID=UPI00223CE6F6|nr:lecithin retinol acyltransferase-like [Hippocampus zosterae]
MCPGPFGASGACSHGGRAHLPAGQSALLLVHVMLNALAFLLDKVVFFVTCAHPPPPPLERERVYRRGDLLEVPRTLFTHFGIYLGDGRVAHLIPDILPAVTSDVRHLRRKVTNTRLVLGVLSKRASVRVDSVEDFAYGASVRLNTHAMESAGRGPPDDEEAARRAERLLGSVTYSLLWNNCEHFVTWCRYGDARSLQTEQFCQWLKSLIRDQRNAAVAGMLGLLSLACLGVSSGTALPAVFIPFTLWMAS